MSTNRDLMAVGLGTALIGILAAAVTLGTYGTAVTAAYSCSYPATAACQNLYVQETTSLLWFFVSLVPFAAGLTAFLFSFRGTEASTTRPLGRICPVCKTWQVGQFCPNDGTKLV